MDAAAMEAPDAFSWIERPLLAAMARPDDAAQCAWLRAQNIQLIISLTENSPPRSWINEAGLMSIHLPVMDMTAPTQEQIDQCVATIAKANAKGLGVALHCTAGLGRTGTMLACYFVHQGMSANDAVARVRRLRPGSVETDEQTDAVVEYARRLKMQREFEGP